VKTISLKKVSAVAVASLGFGLLSVVPANAAGTGTVVSIYASSKSVGSNYGATAVVAVAAASIDVGIGGTAVTVVAGSGTFVAADVGKALYNTTTNIGYIGTICTVNSAVLITLCAGSTATVAAASTGLAASLVMGTPAATTVSSTIINADGINGMTVKSGASAAIILKLSNAEGATAARARYSIDNAGTMGINAAAMVAAQTTTAIPFTAPTAAGTYTGKIQYSVAGTFLGTAADQIDIGFTLTVTAASAYSNTLSQAYIVAGNAGTIATSATDLLPVSSTKTAKAANAASILINAFKADGTAMTAPGTVTVTVSGAGALSSTFDETTNTPTADQCSATTNARVVTFTADAVNNVIICADGTSGTGTYTISVTNDAGVTTTLATKTVVFFGSVAKIVATPIFTIGAAAGGTTGQGIAARAADANAPAVVVKATDSSGNVVSGLTISALSSDLTVVNSAITIAEDDGVAAKTSGGAGFYNASFSTPSSATSGKSATLTFRILDPADVLGVAYLTSAVTLTIGGTVATEVLSFDKTSYAPGEAMVVTVTAKDSSGNPVADGTASPAITFSKAVGGTTPAVSVYVGGKKATSATAPTVFAPTIAGSFQALATSGNTAKSAITAASSVTDANAAITTQIDALNAKIVALNALIAKIMKKLGVK
jgi:hypothetical protein